MRIGRNEENQNDMTLAVPFDTDISRAYQDLGWGHGATSQKWWFERPSAGRVVLWSLSLQLAMIVDNWFAGSQHCQISRLRQTHISPLVILVPLVPRVVCIFVGVRPSQVHIWLSSHIPPSLHCWRPRAQGGGKKM
jgi:hypothetical protein